MAGHSYQELENGLGKLTLNNGSGNPITTDLLEELHTQLRQLTQNPPRSLILDAGESPIFSGGFALPVIASWNRSQIREFFGLFLDTLHSLLLLPCPTIGAIGGHAIAGGFILSLGCDFRVVKSSGIKLGLSEVDLGVAVPAGTQVLFEERTSPQAALRFAMFGELFDSETALKIGYALSADVEPLKKAIELANRLANKPGHGTQVTKLFRAEALSARVRAADEAGMERFLDSWFSEIGQARIQALAAKLSAK